MAKRRGKSRGVLIIALILLAVIIGGIVSNATNGFQESLKNFAVIYKALGISIITVFVSDIAADSGNKALSDRMIFAGKAAIIILVMPVFIQVLEIIKRFTE